jgi:hypothetical protein
VGAHSVRPALPQEFCFVYAIASFVGWFGVGWFASFGSAGEGGEGTAGGEGSADLAGTASDGGDIGSGIVWRAPGAWAEGGPWSWWALEAVIAWRGGTYKGRAEWAWWA